jgi:hypothetical protein
MLESCRLSCCRAMRGPVFPLSHPLCSRVEQSNGSGRHRRSQSENGIVCACVCTQARRSGVDGCMGPPIVWVNAGVVLPRPQGHHLEGDCRRVGEVQRVRDDKRRACKLWYVFRKPGVATLCARADASSHSLSPNRTRWFSRPCSASSKNTTHSVGSCAAPTPSPPRSASYCLE